MASARYHVVAVRVDASRFGELDALARAEPALDLRAIHDMDGRPAGYTQIVARVETERRAEILQKALQARGCEAVVFAYGTGVADVLHRLIGKLWPSTPTGGPHRLVARVAAADAGGPVEDDERSRRMKVLRGLTAQEQAARRAPARRAKLLAAVGALVLMIGLVGLGVGAFVQWALDSIDAEMDASQVASRPPSAAGDEPPGAGATGNNRRGEDSPDEGGENAPPAERQRQRAEDEPAGANEAGAPPPPPRPPQRSSLAAQVVGVCIPPAVGLTVHGLGWLVGILLVVLGVLALRMLQPTARRSVFQVGLATLTAAAATTALWLVLTTPRAPAAAAADAPDGSMDDPLGGASESGGDEPPGDGATEPAGSNGDDSGAGATDGAGKPRTARELVASWNPAPAPTVTVPQLVALLQPASANDALDAAQTEPAADTDAAAETDATAETDPAADQSAGADEAPANEASPTEESPSDDVAAGGDEASGSSETPEDPQGAPGTKPPPTEASEESEPSSSGEEPPVGSDAAAAASDETRPDQDEGPTAEPPPECEPARDAQRGLAWGWLGAVLLLGIGLGVTQHRWLGAVDEDEEDDADAPAP